MCPGEPHEAVEGAGACRTTFVIREAGRLIGLNVPRFHRSVLPGGRVEPAPPEAARAQA
ncbi:hypothetical protein [Celeribacter indicus]|uniref:hypothetical protein n=1 Tax=Celeribacter indicus TaxID=1208324 RepID=UPI000B14B8B9|nr:hypothetical protein [Celeribacter indicus]